MTFKKPYTIGIVGGSGSGKTSFLRDLVARLPEGSCCVVSQDNYYRNMHDQERDANGQPNFDLPTAIHRDRFFEDMTRLVRGESITLTEYTFNLHERQVRRTTIESAGLLLMEGLFVFHYEEIRTLLDLRVFIEAPESVCRERRIQRDYRERGYPPHEVAYQWENHVLPAYQRYILPYRSSADVIVSNHESYEEGLQAVLARIACKEQRTQ